MSSDNQKDSDSNIENVCNQNVHNAGNSDNSVENAASDNIAVENTDENVEANAENGNNIEEHTENTENTESKEKASDDLESNSSREKNSEDEAGLVSDYLVEGSEDFEKAVEAVIYVEGTIALARLSKIFTSTDEKIKDTIALINAKYKESGSVIEIIEVGDNFMMTVGASVFGVLSRIYDKKRKKKISKSFLQTLSIIAYKQPITKAEIDEIRQSDSSYHVKALLDDGFIEWKGRKDILNKPQTYGTTDKFLMHFNINSIADLPKLRELKELEFDKDV